MLGLKRRGPKPTLRKAERVTVMLEGRALRAVDAFARSQRVNRSAALRELLARGIRGLNAAERGEQ